MAVGLAPPPTHTPPRQTVLLRLRDVGDAVRAVGARDERCLVLLSRFTEDEAGELPELRRVDALGEQVGDAVIAGTPTHRAS